MSCSRLGHTCCPEMVPFTQLVLASQTAYMRACRSIAASGMLLCALATAGKDDSPRIVPHCTLLCLPARHNALAMAGSSMSIWPYGPAKGAVLARGEDRFKLAPRARGSSWHEPACMDRAAACMTMSWCSLKSTVGVSANPTGCFESQHPPFFSKMRTFFKNRLAWLKFYCNAAFNHASRFLSCIFKKKFFFPVGILSQIGRCR
jgi:hypothetical protein